MQIAPSTYYGAKNRPPSARSVSDAATTAVIAKVHEDNDGAYGVTKVHAEPRRNGRRVARCTIHRLIRAAGLRGFIGVRGLAPRWAAPARRPARTWWSGPSPPPPRIGCGLLTSPTAERDRCTNGSPNLWR
ncbi:IS3 family transposase [Kocuria sp. LHG3120]|uniref:IS3 family transposase n=1 Tax=Kocuria sp. LHG3120 TaxID=2804590 RepID=UPI003CF33333